MRRRVLSTALWVLASAAALTCAGSSFAQDDPPPPPRGGPRPPPPRRGPPPPPPRGGPDDGREGGGREGGGREGGGREGGGREGGGREDGGPNGGAREGGGREGQRPGGREEQGDDDDSGETPKSLDAEAVQRAIARGVAWLEARQQQDGSWDEGFRDQFPAGATAIATLALIKTGHGDSAAVKKALRYLERTAPTKTYGAGLTLMAMEATCAPTRQELLESDRGYTTTTRGGFRRAPAARKRLVNQVAQWLVKTRHDPLWGYPMTPPDSGGTRTRGESGTSERGGQGGQGGRGGPPGRGGGGPPGRGGPNGGGPPGRGGPNGGGPNGGGPNGGGPNGGGPNGGGPNGGPKALNEWDHSNTQYALLGLGAADRLGVKVPAAPLYEVLEQLLAGQEQSGPKIEHFAVPAADASFKDIEALARDLGKARAAARGGGPDDGVTRTRAFYGTLTRASLRARGWSYVPSGGPSNDHPESTSGRGTRTNNSMTAACLAAVIVIKATLDDQGGFRRYRERVDQSIRDGAAYLAKHFTVVDRAHPYYYLYGLERVGVLTGCEELGGHDWYVEGGARLLRLQSRDGSWGNSSRGRSQGPLPETNSLPQTCFALLFLARATPPIVPELPERPRTGSLDPRQD